MHGVLASPSKLLMPPVPENAEGSSTVELRRQVPYSTFLKHGQNIADLVTSLCPLAQNVVSAHFSKVYELLSDGDYSNARHNGTCVDGLANALAGIGVPDRSAAGPDMPKQRVVTTRGRNALHRLGSNKVLYQEIRRSANAHFADHRVMLIIGNDRPSKRGPL